MRRALRLRLLSLRGGRLSRVNLLLHWHPHLQLGRLLHLPSNGPLVVLSRLRRILSHRQSRSLNHEPVLDLVHDPSPVPAHNPVLVPAHTHPNADLSPDLYRQSKPKLKHNHKPSKKTKEHPSSPTHPPSTSTFPSHNPIPHPYYPTMSRKASRWGRWSL